MLVNNLTGFNVYRSLSLSFVTSTNGTGTTITWPTVQANDLAVLFCVGIDAPAGPGNETPTGFTSILSGGSNEVDWDFCYKKCAGTEGGTSIDVMDSPGSDVVSILLIFRPSRNFTTVTTSTFQAQYAGGADPAAQTVSAAGQGFPLIVFGIAANDSNATFGTVSPAFDGTITDGTSDMNVGYKIYNYSAVDHSIDKNDEGARNFLASGWLKIS